VKSRDGNDGARVTPEVAVLTSNPPPPPQAKASFDLELEAADLIVGPQNPADVARGEIHDLLIEQLQDVSIYSFYIFV
jgi:hypothetical protein